MARARESVPQAHVDVTAQTAAWVIVYTKPTGARGLMFFDRTEQRARDQMRRQLTRKGFSVALFSACRGC